MLKEFKRGFTCTSISSAGFWRAEHAIQGIIGVYRRPALSCKRGQPRIVLFTHFICNSTVHYCHHRNVIFTLNITDHRTSRRKGTVHEKQQGKKCGRGEWEGRGLKRDEGWLLCSFFPHQFSLLFCLVLIWKSTNYIAISFFLNFSLWRPVFVCITNI